jgi:hypothetical protein
MSMFKYITLEFNLENLLQIANENENEIVLSKNQCLVGIRVRWVVECKILLILSKKCMGFMEIAEFCELTWHGDHQNWAYF